MSSFQLGGWLAQERESRGLTIDAVAAQTKIPRRHIESFERGEVLDLPAFYQRAEIRAVARAIGVDEQAAVARLDALLTPEDVPAPASPQPAPRVRPEYVLATLGVLLLVVLLGWDSYGRTTASASPVATSRPAAARVPDTSPRRAPVAPVGVASEAAVQPGAALAEDPPKAPTGPTELVISTQPEGARVTVNGIGWGLSPVTIRHVEPGEKRIRVSMDGYTSAERSVTVDEGSRAAVRIRLAGT